MLSGSLAQPCALARLTVHALLARFRLLLPDLEKTSGTDALAGLFKVRAAEIGFRDLRAPPASFWPEAA